MEDSSYWKTTSDLFSKLIEKPKMSEKLLTKPPPKFIYDIIISTMKATKFPNGLYSETELDPKYWESDKNNRKEFLKKSLDILKIINKAAPLGTLEVKVENMLAGEEPAKTNQFLQAFHKAATMGKDFSNYIKKYLEHLKKKEDEKNQQAAIPEKKEPEKKEPEKKEPVKQPTKEPIKEPTKEPVKEVKKQVIQQQEKPKPKEVQPQAETRKVNKEQSDKIQSKEEDDKEDLGVDTGNKITMGGLKLGKDKKINKVQGDEMAAKKPTLNLKDIESIKSYIHEICSNANPISKLIDYLPEDIDSMNKELSHWKSEAARYTEQYEEEIKKSEEVIFPLEKEYLELEETIRDEMTRIKSIKQRILTNEMIIQNLINGVISVKNIDK